MDFSADLRRHAAPRLALVVVAALAASAFTAGPETTAAMLTSTATAESPITTRAACLGEPTERAQAYTSGLVGLAEPSLRWSFSDGLLPDAVAIDGTTKPSTVARGLLQCDPADFPEVKATAGALQLAPGGSTGLALTNQPLTEAFTLLLWVLPDAKTDGELASLGNSTGELALGIAGSRVSLSFPSDGKTPAVSIDMGDPGRAHLVAVVYSESKLTLSVDGRTTEGTESTGATATTWTPNGTPNAFTIGARAGHPSAGALVDEVTLLTGPASTMWLESLVGSDRWWMSPGWTFSRARPPTATAAIAPTEPSALAPAEPPTPAPAEPPAPAPADPSSSPTAAPDSTVAVEVLAPPVEQTSDSQTKDDRRSRSTTSRHKPSR